MQPQTRPTDQQIAVAIHNSVCKAGTNFYAISQQRQQYYVEIARVARSMLAPQMCQCS